MQSPASISINCTGNLGENAKNLQVYAPGAGTLQAASFAKNSPPVFSAEWLLFYQHHFNLVGRAQEIARLQQFLRDPRPFQWWALYGPAGVGKSRLAYDFVQSHSAGWDGGFLRADRLISGAVANWKPSRDTIWVVDYAAAHGRELSTMLEILQHQADPQGPKVRVLLVERDASMQSTWLKRLRLEAGYSWGLIESARHADPLQVNPLGAQATELLGLVLQAAGRTPQEAAGMVSQISQKQLRKMTDDGRPLLVALAAAAMHFNQVASMAKLTMPRQLLDIHLGRELRLWQKHASAEPLFSAASRMVFATTLANEIDIVRSCERPPVDASRIDDAADIEDAADARHRQTLLDLAEAIEFHDESKARQVLEYSGITDHTYWALQPDALGERLIQVLLRPPLNAGAYYTDIPRMTVKQVAMLFDFARRQTRTRLAATMSRLPRADLLYLLSTSMRHSTCAVHDLLALLDEICRIRGEGFELAEVRTIINQDTLQARYSDAIGQMVEHSFALARAGSAQDVTDRIAALQTQLASDFAATGLWLLPRMLRIAQIPGARIRLLAPAYFAALEQRQPPDRDALMPAIALYRRAINDAIAGIATEYDVDHFTTNGHAYPVLDEELAHFCSAFTMLGAAAQTHDRSGTAIAVDVWSALAESAAQTSYVLLASGLQRQQSGQPGHRALADAGQIAELGIGFGRRGGDRHIEYLCLRNLLASLGTAAPTSPAYRTLRTQTFAQHRLARRSQEFGDLASDVCRSAMLSRDLIDHRKLLEQLHADLTWLPELSQRFDREGHYYLAYVNQCIARGETSEAYGMAVAYRTLICANIKPLEATSLQEIFQRIAENPAPAHQPLTALMQQDMMAFAAASPDHARFAMVILSQRWLTLHQQGAAFTPESFDVELLQLSGAEAKALCGVADRLTIDREDLRFFRFKGRDGSPLEGTNAFRFAVSQGHEFKWPATDPGWTFLHRALSNAKRSKDFLDKLKRHEDRYQRL
ncbi:ATP-binding protein [Duganella sp. BJB1802]|uniref:ATP-binding protein n=1 Tax=Duganella sp. BJB1802 TaxID=2744575 RepID=UPI001593991C|nr:ATP-binding protein [Duganella sp. BJB1802]NVD72274.1 ATP-binding protein [Duganella sp. BJB1802]